MAETAKPNEKRKEKEISESESVMLVESMTVWSGSEWRKKWKLFVNKATLSVGRSRQRASLCEFMIESQNAS
jgi:hypothetical protein